ncbi:MAG: uroporphyrinogen decarboxylase family protein [Bacteroidales bacterium]|nr:uroporphyrinogen decarboxylase family protein [Bacteroidales bacterium]
MITQKLFQSANGGTAFHPILMQLAAHIYGKTYTEFMTDYRILVDSNMKCLELFKHDAVSVISDPYRETSAFGAKIIFDGNNSPRAERLVENMQDVESLQIPNPYNCERTLDRIKGVEYYRELLGKDFPVIGWIEGPLAEACDLGGVTEILMQLMMEPEMVTLLMAKCVEMGKSFAKAQIDAGCNIMGIGDAICSQLSDDMYAEYVLPFHQDLIEYIHSLGCAVKLHICGNITHLMPHLAKTGADIIDLDWMVDMEEARKVTGEETWLCGNIDPVSVVQDGSKERIREAYSELRSKKIGEKFIFMAGCEITPFTPIEHVQEMRKVSRN